MLFSKPNGSAPRTDCWDSRVPPSPFASARSSTPTASTARRYSPRPHDGLSTLTTLSSIRSGGQPGQGWVSPVSPVVSQSEIGVGCGWRIFLGSDSRNAIVNSTRAQRIEQTIRTYIQACNDADAEAIAACFCPDAVHYFPHIPKWSGAATIGRNFAENVREFGRHWTVDQFIVDVDRGAAALEGTQNSTE